MKQNPFDISFGKKPNQTVDRILQSEEILSTFTSDVISQQLFMITGVRGYGKTVMLNIVANTLEEEKNWIVLRLNPDRDLLTSMGATLCEDASVSELLKKAKININLFHVGLEVETDQQIVDIESAVIRMLKQIRKAGKRVLVTIDEVTNTPQMRVFASSYQIMIGQELPVFLLMTGLYENIKELQDEKNQTFLYRAPRIALNPLNFGAMAARYKKVFSLSDEEARWMASLTKGYPFAFQALGYSAFRNGTEKDQYYDTYRQLLEEYVYEKIWPELSGKERHILYGVANCPSGSIQDINAFLGLKNNEINQYRKRLIDKGILSSEERGKLLFTLPLFDLFVQDRVAAEESLAV